MSNSHTHRVLIETDKAGVDHLSSILDDAGFDGFTSWEPTDLDSAVLVFYRESASDAQALLGELNEVLAEGEISGSYSCHADAVEDEDWETAWKKFFHAARVSTRIVVRPSWEEWHGEAGLQEIVVDPGMSFGTGLHATTRACIRFLDELEASGESFLDVGCGSGILSIAAAKLGFANIRAFDIDAEAVACTIRNFTSNGLRSTDIDVDCADISSISTGRSYSVVAVNILAPVIEASVANIARLVDPAGGHLLLAGLDAGQFARISSLFIGEEFSLLARVEEGEWVSGMLKR